MLRTTVHVLLQAAASSPVRPDASPVSSFRFPGSGASAVPAEFRVAARARRMYPGRSYWPQRMRLQPVVGVLLPNPELETSRTILEGIRSILHPNGFSVVQHSTLTDEMQRGASLAGLLIPGTHASADSGKAEDVPVVSFADARSPMVMADVAMDRECLLRHALDCLRTEGHRQIAFFHSPTTGLDSEAGRRLLHNAQRMAGVKLRSLCLGSAGASNQASAGDAQTVHEWIQREGVTALLCCSEGIALRAMQISRTLCPAAPPVRTLLPSELGELTISGTRLRSPWKSIGCIAAHRLLARTRRPGSPSCGAFLVQPSVVQP